MMTYTYNRIRLKYKADNCIKLNDIDEYVNIIKNDKFNSVEDLVDKLNVRYIKLQFHGNITLDNVSEVCFTDRVTERSVLNKLKKII